MDLTLKQLSRSQTSWTTYILVVNSKRKPGYETLVRIPACLGLHRPTCGNRLWHAPGHGDHHRLPGRNHYGHAERLSDRTAGSERFGGTGKCHAISFAGHNNVFRGKPGSCRRKRQLLPMCVHCHFFFSAGGYSAGCFGKRLSCLCGPNFLCKEYWKDSDGRMPADMRAGQSATDILAGHDPGTGHNATEG